MKIGVRLVLNFGIIICIICFMGIVNFYYFNKINQNTENIFNDRMLKINSCDRIQENIRKSFSDTKDVLVQSDPSKINEAIQNIENARVNISKEFEFLDANLKSNKSRGLLKQADSLRKIFIASRAKVVELGRLNKDEEALAIMNNEMSALANNYVTSIDSLLAYERFKMKTESDEILDIGSVSKFWIIVQIIFSFIVSGVIVYFLTISITRPLKQALNAADSIAEGDFNVNLNSDKKDEPALLLNALKRMSDNIETLVGEVKELSSQAIAGKLDGRAHADGFKGEYKELVTGINDTLDAIIKPLNVTAEYVDRISKGDIPQKISDEYQGDFNAIKNNINQCIDAVNLLIGDVKYLAESAVDGKLNVRAEENKHHGDFRAIVKGFNQTLDSVIGPLNVAAEYVDKISKGDIPEPIFDNYNGEFNNIKDNLNVCIDSINMLVIDANMLAQAAVQGNLATRADASKHRGDFRKIIEGVNNTLDSVINPLNTAADYVEKISLGDIPSPISDNYQGDFNLIKNNLNNLILATNKVTEAAKQIAQGNLEINLTKRSANDEMIAGVISIADSIKEVVSGVNEYILHTNNGEIEKIQFDTNKFQGAFQDIFKGLNQAAYVTVTPLLEILSYIQSLERGDLTFKIKGDYKGGFAALKNAANNAADSINELIQQVSLTVDEVAKGSLQVSDASTALSQGATEQAASLEEITSSMSQVGSQTRENAENANKANSLTFDAKEAAEKGNIEMTRLNKAMDEINESSKNISKIIRVIDEIAFQTNLLALNAAVEAARAGRHGKGFAVVAEEVRNLASRSAAAAKETSALIEDSLQSVEMGTLLASKTSEALEEIKTGSIKAADIVIEIASLSSEQALAISQINEGLNQIDKVTQTNTASAEESASAAEELSGQAAQLKMMLTRFKLQNEFKDDFENHNFNSSNYSLELSERAPRNKKVLSEVNQ